VERIVSRSLEAGIVWHRHGVSVPRGFWGDVVEAPHRLLLLDYDGTMAPFAENRMEARPLPATVRSMTAIARGGRTSLGVVSGRPVRELRDLIRLRDIILVGEHGWEVLMPGEILTQHRLPPGVEVALRETARLSSSAPWGSRLEVKRTGLVMHTRGLREEEAAGLIAQCRTVFEDLGRPAGLRIVDVHDGIELRAPYLDKGSAVRSLLALSPAGTFAVYLGDDQTDDDAFRVVRERGLGIQVGRDVGPTAAEGRIDGPESVAAFLDEWTKRVERPGAVYRGGA
jgi:trehalose 6-phosphate phosphatase